MDLPLDDSDQFPRLGQSNGRLIIRRAFFIRDISHHLEQLPIIRIIVMELPQKRAEKTPGAPSKASQHIPESSPRVSAPVCVA